MRALELEFDIDPVSRVELELNPPDETKEEEEEESETEHPESP